MVCGWDGCDLVKVKKQVKAKIGRLWISRHTLLCVGRQDGVLGLSLGCTIGFGDA